MLVGCRRARPDPDVAEATVEHAAGSLGAAALRCGVRNRFGRPRRLLIPIYRSVGFLYYARDRILQVTDHLELRVGSGPHFQPGLLNRGCHTSQIVEADDALLGLGFVKEAAQAAASFDASEGAVHDGLIAGTVATTGAQQILADAVEVFAGQIQGGAG